MGEDHTPGDTPRDDDDATHRLDAPPTGSSGKESVRAEDRDATSSLSPVEMALLALEFESSTPVDVPHLSDQAAGRLLMPSTETIDYRGSHAQQTKPTDESAASDSTAGWTGSEARPGTDPELSGGLLPETDGSLSPDTETRNYLSAYDPSATKPRDGEPSTEHAFDGGRKPREGPQIPGYTILGVLGQGGMGLVYKAHHLALDRTVALKVILGGDHARDEHRARFLTEAQAVARLRHPNIVQIYEIGETEGLPYFSLEYVDGGSLEQSVNRQPQDPRWSATLVERLARAMHAAHCNSIIHRDLKPSNVLLTREGEPKVTDFGLAKRLESDSDQTRTGSIMGTPSYMAPEQAWGRNSEVGPHSDLYSIGAILYTLLTGRPPFQGTSALETLEQVRTQEPVPPSRLQGKLHRDLETICLKCLEKEPSKRYPNTEALANDLHRFLQGDTIFARPVSAPERLWRLALRNKRVALLAAAVLVLLVAVALTATTYAAILSQKNEELRVTTEKEKSARRQAEIGVNQAFEQNSNALQAWKTLGRLTIEDLKSIPGARDLRQKFLNEILHGFRHTTDGMEQLYQVSRQSENAQAADFAMAGVHKMLGDELLELGQKKEAREHYDRMNAIVEQAAAAAPGNLDLEYQLANSRAVLADFNLMVMGDAKAALGDLEEALRLRRHRLEVEPDSDDAKLRVANALGHLAMCHQHMGELDAVKALYLEEVKIRETLSDQAKSEFETRREFSGLYDQLGKLSLAGGQLSDGRRYLERSSAIRQALAAEKSDHLPNLRDLNRSLVSLGDLCLLFQNDPAAARKYYEQALAAFRKIHAIEPISTHKADISNGCYFLATALLRLGEKEKSQTLYRECLDIRRALANDPDAKIPQINLAVALARCGEHAEAARIARKVLSPPENSLVYIEAACILALCSGATSEPAMKRSYTAETVDAIRKGYAEGWRDLERLRVDPDLDPVRGDPAYQQFVLEFQQATKPSAAGP